MVLRLHTPVLTNRDGYTLGPSRPLKLVSVEISALSVCLIALRVSLVTVALTVWPHFCRCLVLR